MDSDAYQKWLEAIDGLSAVRRKARPVVIGSGSSDVLLNASERRLQASRVGTSWVTDLPRQSPTTPRNQMTAAFAA